MIVSGYVTFYQTNKFFVNILIFHCWQNGFAGRIWPAGHSSLETPAANRLVVAKSCYESWKCSRNITCMMVINQEKHRKPSFWSGRNEVVNDVLKSCRTTTTTTSSIGVKRPISRDAKLLTTSTGVQKQTHDCCRSSKARLCFSSGPSLRSFANQAIVIVCFIFVVSDATMRAGKGPFVSNPSDCSSELTYTHKTAVLPAATYEHLSTTLFTAGGPQTFLPEGHVWYILSDIFFQID